MAAAIDDRGTVDPAGQPCLVSTTAAPSFRANMPTPHIVLIARV
jgi:hypothetical protein